MGWDGVSHISPSRYKYRFTGSEYINISDSSSLDITGSFSFGFLIKPNPISRLSYAIMSKGHPTDATQGSISMESINGFLRVYLHSGSYTLYHTTNNPVLNTNQIVFIEVTWNTITKNLKVYKNGIEQGTTLIGTPNFIGNINVNNDNIEFGRATGKQPLIGTVYDIIYLNRVRSSLEITNYYDTIKYTGSYTDIGTIIYSSDRDSSNRYQLHTCKSDGTDQVKFYESAHDDTEPRFSTDWSKVIYSTNQDNGIKICNVDGSDNIDASLNVDNETTNYSDFHTNLHDGSTNRFSPSLYINGSTTYVYWSSKTSSHYSIDCIVFLNTLQSSQVNFTRNLLGNDTTVRTFPCINTDATKFLIVMHPSYSSSTSYPNYLIQYTINPSTGSNENPYYFIASGNAGEYIIYPKYSYLGDKIGFSKKISNYYQVIVTDVDGGNPVQITDGTWHSEFHCFSPDSTKVLYSSKETGNWQLHVCNLDGSGNRNISNNAFNDRFGDWRP